MKSECKFNKRFEDIEIPDNLDMVIEKSISRAKIDMKKKNKAKKLVLAASSFAIVFTGAISAAYVSPVVANIVSQIPLVKSVFKISPDNGIKAVKDKGLSQTCDKSVTDKNITLAIKDVYYDKSRICIGYVIENNKNSKAGSIDNFWFYVNGKAIGGGGSSRYNSQGNNLYSGETTFIPAEQLPQKFMFTMKVDKISGVTGNWKISIPLSREKADNGTKECVTNASQKVHGKTITVKKVGLAPSSTTLEIEYTHPKDKLYDFNINYQLFDDKGNPLQSISSGGGSSENGNIKTEQVTASFEPLSKATKYLRLKVAYDVFEGNDTKVITNKKNIGGTFPIELSQGKIGKIIISKIEYLEDKTRVHYTVEGDDLSLQSDDISLVDTFGKVIDKITESPSKDDNISRGFICDFKPVTKGSGLSATAYEINYRVPDKDINLKIPLK